MAHSTPALVKLTWETGEMSLKTIMAPEAECPLTAHHDKTSDTLSPCVPFFPLEIACCMGHNGVVLLERDVAKI